MLLPHNAKTCISHVLDSDAWRKKLNYEYPDFIKDVFYPININSYSRSVLKDIANTYIHKDTSLFTFSAVQQIIDLANDFCTHPNTENRSSWIEIKPNPQQKEGSVAKINLLCLCISDHVDIDMSIRTYLIGTHEEGVKTEIDFQLFREAIFKEMLQKRIMLCSMTNKAVAFVSTPCEQFGNLLIVSLDEFKKQLWMDINNKRILNKGLIKLHTQHEKILEDYQKRFKSGSYLICQENAPGYAICEDLTKFLTDIKLEEGDDIIIGSVYTHNKFPECIMVAYILN